MMQRFLLIALLGLVALLPARAWSQQSPACGVELGGSVGGANAGGSPGACVNPGQFAMIGWTLNPSVSAMVYASVDGGFGAHVAGTGQTAGGQYPAWTTPQSRYSVTGYFVVYPNDPVHGGDVHIHITSTTCGGDVNLTVHFLGCPDSGSGGGSNGGSTNGGTTNGGDTGGDPGDGSGGQCQVCQCAVSIVGNSTEVIKTTIEQAVQDMLDGILGLFVPDQAHIDKMTGLKDSVKNLPPFLVAGDLQTVLAKPSDAGHGGPAPIALGVPVLETTVGSGGDLVVTKTSTVPIDFHEARGTEGLTFWRGLMGALVYISFAMGIVKKLFPQQVV